MADSRNSPVRGSLDHWKDEEPDPSSQRQESLNWGLGLMLAETSSQLRCIARPPGTAEAPTGQRTQQAQKASAGLRLYQAPCKVAAYQACYAQRQHGVEQVTCWYRPYFLRKQSLRFSHVHTSCGRPKRSEKDEQISLTGFQDEK